MTSRGEFAPGAPVQGTTNIAVGPDHRRSKPRKMRDFGSPVPIGLLKSIKPACRMFTAPKSESSPSSMAVKDCLSGVAPITTRSGKSRIVLMRQAVHVGLRNNVYH